MAESNPAENNRSFIARDEFYTIIANASKGTASVKYGRAFLGSKYTLRLELDGKLDDQTKVRIYYIRGEKKIALTEAYSGQLLDFTTKETFEAFTLGAPSKNLCCEIFVYGNEAVIAHGMMTLEWSPSMAVDGYGRGVDVQGEAGLPYLPGTYYTIVRYGDENPDGGGDGSDGEDGGGGVSSWTEIYQVMHHPTTNEPICILLPYTLEDIKGPKGDTGDGLDNIEINVEHICTNQYVSYYNAKLSADGATLSTAHFNIPHGIYDANLMKGDVNDEGFSIHLARTFQTTIDDAGEIYQDSSVIYDQLQFDLAMTASSYSSTDENCVTTCGKRIGLSFDNYNYYADVSTLFGVSSASLAVKSSNSTGTIVELALAQYGEEEITSSVFLPLTSSSGCTTIANVNAFGSTADGIYLNYYDGTDCKNAWVEWCTIDDYLCHKLDLCGAVLYLNGYGDSTLSSVDLSGIAGGSSSGTWKNTELSVDVNNTHLLFSLTQYCGTCSSSHTVTDSISWATLSSYINSGGSDSGTTTPTGQYVSSIDYCLLTDGIYSTGYLDITYGDGTSSQIPYGYGVVGSGGGGCISSIQAVKNSSGYVTDVIYWYADGSSSYA